MSFEAQVDTGDGHYTGNGLRFETESEAEGYVAHLANRWTMVRETRVIDSGDPVTHRWSLETDELTNLETGHSRVPPQSVTV